MRNASAPWNIDEDLRNRAHELSKSDEFKGFSTDLQGKRIGLVLAGGGAKGAFQAGALLALLDLGLTDFEVIAGTSVGSLNAALFQQAIRRRDRDIVTNMWAHMSLGRVMAWTPLILLQIIAVILYAVASAIILRRVSEPKPGTDISFAAMGLVGGLLLVLLGAVLEVALYFTLAIYTDLTFVQAMKWIYGTALSLPLSYLVVSLMLRATPAIASNKPMKKAIEDLGIDRIANDHPPIICTLGHNVTFRPPITAAMRGEIWPIYMPLAKASSNIVVKTLLLSAAIPYLFPSKRICRKWCVDGGLTDNVPLLGVFIKDQLDPVNAVFVLQLSCDFDTNGDEAFRCFRLAHQAVSGAGKIVIVRPLLEQWLEHTEFYVIQPSTNLRRSLGTLDFRKSRARTLLDEGYAAALTQITDMARTGKRFDIGHAKK